MSDILCIYYSRTGHTRRAVKEIAEALGAEITAITDDCDRSGWRGYMRCGMDAMKTSTRPLQPFETEKPLGAYKLVIGRFCPGFCVLVFHRRTVSGILHCLDNSCCIKFILIKFDLHTVCQQIHADIFHPGKLSHTFLHMG